MKQTILIAEDSVFNREILHSMFQEEYHVMIAEDGEDAMEKLRLHKQEISLLLLDLVMPKMDGFQVLREMQKEKMLEDIITVIITGSNDQGDELRALELGATELLRKPFLPAVVKRRVENLMELWMGRKALKQVVQEQSQTIETYKNYDGLTGLLNRARFLQAVNLILSEDIAEKKSVASYVIYGNICNFKYYNAKYGVQEGNAVLLQVAEWLTGKHADDLNARFEGDHFVTFSQNPNVQAVVQDLNRSFNENYERYGLKLKVGIYCINQPGIQAQIACDCAKIACDSIRYREMNVAVYDERMHKKVELTNYVMQHLDEAMEQKHIKVYYQPVIRSINNAVCGMEALARWIDPVVGVLSPADFIPVLEQNRMIAKLDMYILRESCRLIQGCLKAGETIPPISFNLSRYDFAGGDIYEEVERIVAEYGVPKDMIHIEITESTAMEDPRYLKAVIARFRQGGYQVWMDDFGSGYSSLNQLKDFTFDEIKLDMVFLRQFDEKSRQIIKSVIFMSKNLGINTLSEGVETEEQAAFLREIGCSRLQGFLYSEPKPYEELRKQLEEKKFPIESRSWRTYYDRLNQVDFMTNRAMALVEYDGESYRYIFVNEPYRKILDVIVGGEDGVERSWKKMNSQDFPLAVSLRNLQKKLHMGDPSQELEYQSHDRDFRLEIRVITENKEHAINSVEITNLAKGDGRVVK